MSEGRPGKHGDRRSGLNLVRDFVHQHPGRVLDPLGAEDERLAAGRQAAATDRRCWAGVTTRKASQSASASRSPVARIAGLSGMPLRKSLFSWRALIASTTSGSRAQSRISSPPAAATWASAVPQAPRADHADLHAFTPAPRAFSASGSSGQRARAGASRPSISPASKRSAPAQAIIAALSVHSHERRRDEGQAARGGKRGQRGAHRLIGGDAAGDDQGGGAVRRLDRARGAVDQAVDHRLLEGGGDVGIAVAARIRAPASPRS